MTAATQDLTESQEDYLEAIHGVIAEKGAVRAKDLAKRLHVGAPSVTGALRLLADKGLVNYAPYDVITLTGEGERVARDVAKRHAVMRSFFEGVLGVSAREAEDAACHMEHFMSPKLLKRLQQFVEFSRTCPKGGPDWRTGFMHYCEHGTLSGQCTDCISEHGCGK